MKRKIYFSVAGFVQIIVSIFAILNANKLIAATIDALSTLPEGMRERMLELYQNSGTTYIYAVAGINIILCIIIICIALSGKLTEKKGAILGLSIGTFFTSAYTISELLAIISIIVIATVKKDDTAKVKEKKPLPVIEKEKVDTKKIVIAVILFVVYFSQFVISRLLPDNMKVIIISNIVFYLTMAILVIVTFYDLLGEHFKAFKENFKAYFQNLIGKVGVYYLVYIAIAVIAAFLSKSGTSVNQKNVESLPIYVMIPLAVLYAPLVEETIFRGSLRRFIKNDKVFIIVSALAFGLVHTAFSEATLFNVIVLGLPYMAMGGFLAYLYVKTNNMWSNIGFHAFHNTCAIILSLLIKGI